MRKRGATYILYKDAEEVMRNNLKAISAALNRSYVTVASWANKGIISKEGYSIKAEMEVRAIEHPKKAKRVRKIRTYASSGMTKWN